MTVEAEPDTLTIETQPLGWRWGSLALFAFIAVWCVAWVLKEGAAALSSLSFFGGLAVGIGIAAVFIDRVYTRWRLQIGPELVSVDRWGLFTSRAWTCRPELFQVGEIDFVGDNGEPSLLGVTRCLRLRLSADDVDFMAGHRDEKLEATRAQILDGVGRGRPADPNSRRG
jgi:hypothetical protein